MSSDAMKAYMAGKITSAEYFARTRTSARRRDVSRPIHVSDALLLGARESSARVRPAAEQLARAIAKSLRGAS